MLATWNISFDLLGMSRANHLLWLISKSLGHFFMHPLHFRVCDRRQFLVPCLVRCDLRRSSTFHALLFEVCLDLLTSRTGSIDILACITGDLRLATLSRFDVVTLAF